MVSVFRRNHCPFIPGMGGRIWQDYAHGLDEWLRRRIRMCYWKQWRHGRTKYRKLTELGVPKSFAIMMAGSSKSYWHLSKSYATQCGMSNNWLKEQGLVNIKELWCKAQGYN